MKGSGRKVTWGVGIVFALVVGVPVLWQSSTMVASAQDRLDLAQITLANDRAAARQIVRFRVLRAQAAEKISTLPVGNLTQPALVDYLGRLTRDRNVTLSNVTFLPATPEPKPSAAQTAPAVPGVSATPPATQELASPPSMATPQPLFVEHPLRVEMTGHYKDVLFAIQDLSCGNALVRLDSDPEVSVADSVNSSVKASFLATLLEINPQFIPPSAGNAAGIPITGRSVKASRARAQVRPCAQPRIARVRRLGARK